MLHSSSSRITEQGMAVEHLVRKVESTGVAAPDAAAAVDGLYESSGESDDVPDDGVDVMDLPNYWDVKRDWADACLDAEVESDDLPRVVQQLCHCEFAS